MLNLPSETRHTLAIACALAALLAGRVFAAGPVVQVQDLVRGSGTVAAPGDVATIHFESWLDNRGRKGRPVYATRGRHEPVSFVIGTEKVMPGWNAGVIGMQPGGRRLVRVPPSAAWGNRGAQGVVPPGSGMIFIIELVSLEKR